MREYYFYHRDAPSVEVFSSNDNGEIVKDLIPLAIAQRVLKNRLELSPFSVHEKEKLMWRPGERVKWVVGLAAYYSESLAREKIIDNNGMEYEIISDMNNDRVNIRLRLSKSTWVSQTIMSFYVDVNKIFDLQMDFFQGPSRKGSLDTREMGKALFKLLSNILPVGTWIESTVDDEESRMFLAQRCKIQQEKIYYVPVGSKPLVVIERGLATQGEIALNDLLDRTPLGDIMKQASIRKDIVIWQGSQSLSGLKALQKLITEKIQEAGSMVVHPYILRSYKSAIHMMENAKDISVGDGPQGIIDLVGTKSLPESWQDDTTLKNSDFWSDYIEGYLSQNQPIHKGPLKVLLIGGVYWEFEHIILNHPDAQVTVLNIEQQKLSEIEWYYPHRARLFRGDAQWLDEYHDRDGKQIFPEEQFDMVIVKGVDESAFGGGMGADIVQKIIHQAARVMKKSALLFYPSLISDYYFKTLPLQAIKLHNYKGKIPALWIKDEGNHAQLSFQIAPKRLVHRTYEHKQNGGIDLATNKISLDIQNAGSGIKFHLDPILLQKLQNTPGFIPVIINIQPMTDLRRFLGLPAVSPTTNGAPA